jgi:hypothetical protein
MSYVQLPPERRTELVAFCLIANVAESELCRGMDAGKIH